MFWKWAGTYRKTERNIGCDPKDIMQRIPQLLANARYWLENHTFPVEEALAKARRALEPAPIRAAEERGAAMSLDTAAEYVLMLTAPGPPSPAVATSPRTVPSATIRSMHCGRVPTTDGGPAMCAVPDRRQPRSRWCA